MDRSLKNRLFALGLGSLLANAGCHHGSRTREIPPNPPLARDGGPAQFHSDPNPLQAGTNGPSMPGGAPMTRGGFGVGGPGGGRGQVGDPPTVFGGEPDSAAKAGEMTMPAGTPNP
ncbi:MAG: hypothetical protein JWN86_1310 [Planctomycetota bacterium]|nr:hypothetical protein [Planctomycetota bacterium]